MAETLPATAVIRLSRNLFDPSRFADVAACNKHISEYLIPAIKQLPGLIQYHTGVSPAGEVVHISVWDTDEHASQMAQLKEMIVDAVGEMKAVGVTLTPIINFPMDWII
ncbi:hypothetical protein [Streptacidiphilus sp. EB129]|jgi:hypothetical protein|uniref:hypothetical protein n=1 Tax=Streptacidiphilus sp. EB129 TaxID=3156262 RepID=UPI00351303C0